MDRFGEAIEADLHKQGLDLLDFFRGKHSWRKLLVILAHLPRASHFRQAEADDDEWVQEAMDAGIAANVGPPTIPAASWTPEVELLTLQVELSQAINANLRVLAHDPHPPRVQPMPRPRTAVDRIRDRARDKRFTSLLDEVAAAQARSRQALVELGGSPDG